jgi:hypothetical protein
MSKHDPERERHWQAMLTQWHQSEQTISAFCKQRNLSKPTFGYWQRKLGFGRRVKPRSPSATFVPMTLVTDPRVEVVLPTGVSLRVQLKAGSRPPPCCLESAPVRRGTGSTRGPISATCSINSPLVRSHPT